jgi:hypothetical protein
MNDKEKALLHPRQIGWDRVEGGFYLPMGLRLFQNDPYEPRPALIVSTVRLDGAHLEAIRPGMIEPETGFETMVFFEECRFFDLYAEHYETREQAATGHADVVKRLREKSLPLTIKITNFWILDEHQAA